MSGINRYCTLQAEDKKAAISELERILEIASPLEQREIIFNLGIINDRKTYSLLIKILEDKKKEDIHPEVIPALAFIKDSRALFPLVNLFNYSESIVIKQRILQYIFYTKDPRAQDFLTDHINKKGIFYDIAEEALKVCVGNHDFEYTYNGRDNEYEESIGTQGQIVVSSEELEKNKKILESDEKYNFFKPQTYIIGKNGQMLIGGYLNEHVQVANGENVIAAGEIKFEKIDSLWRVSYVNGRSCGYFPAESCFKWVKTYFLGTDILFEHDEFDMKFPIDGYNSSDFLSTQKFGRINI